MVIIITIIITGQLELASGSVRVGETARIGYYEQTGLVLTDEQERQPVLQFVIEAVEKAAPVGQVKAGIYIYEYMYIL
jgi:ATPase subunit of ABC transporter with duplicated ATPase domains